MASAKRLIVNADDFGRSTSINAAVIDAHRRGVLTTASLMVNGEAAAEAVALARQNPRLGVGLHLTLCSGTSSLSARDIPNLVNRAGHFRESPIAAGMVYFFSRSAQRQLRREIAAQFDKFTETGLALDHVNGHLHFHLHPTVFNIIRDEIQQRRVRAVRLTFDPARVDWPLGTGRWFYRASHAFIFKALAARSRPFCRQNNVAYTDYVFGLLENARVTEPYILKLLARLPAGNSELYSHPCVQSFKEEYQALISPKVREAIQAENIDLIRYQDLWRN